MILGSSSSVMPMASPTAIAGYLLLFTIIGAGFLFADQQLHALFFGALAFENFSLQGGIGSCQLGGARLHAFL